MSNEWGIRKLGILGALIVVCCATITWGETAEDDVAVKLESRVREVGNRVKEAFVFIGGGSGVVISPDGYMLTNHHVAGKSATWAVVLTGGRQYKADIVAKDSFGDICLLKIRDAKDLPFVPFGDSDALEHGEYVIAVGNPFMLGSSDWEPTVTLGVVSAIHRFQTNYSDAIQTDASINPGNSGGPLFNLDGKLLGINGQIVFRHGNKVNTGVGFAIPTAQIDRFLPHYKAAKGGEIFHGTIVGLTFSTEWSDGKGAPIKDVQKGSTAEKAGFQGGDWIVKVGKYPVHNAHRAQAFILAHPATATVEVTVRRADAEKVLKVTLDSRGAFQQPGQPAQPNRPKGGQPRKK